MTDLQRADGLHGLGKMFDDARQDWQLGGRLWRDVWDLVMADETITSFDKAITRLLASRKYGVGRTKAKQLIVMLDANQAQFLGNTEKAAAILEKRRKLLT